MQRKWRFLLRSEDDLVRRQHSWAADGNRFSHRKTRFCQTSLVARIVKMYSHPPTLASSLFGRDLVLTSAPVDMLLQEAVSPRLRKQRGLEVGADGADGAGGAHEGDGGDDRHGGGSGGSREVRRSASLAVQVRVQTSGAALRVRQDSTGGSSVRHLRCGAVRYRQGGTALAV